MELSIKFRALVYKIDFFISLNNIILKYPLNED